MSIRTFIKVMRRKDGYANSWCINVNHISLFEKSSTCYTGSGAGNYILFDVHRQKPRGDIYMSFDTEKERDEFFDTLSDCLSLFKQEEG